MVPWNSSSGEFAFIWQSKWVGIIAIKTGRTQIYFREDVLVAVASWLRARRVGERVKASSTAILTFHICHSDMRSGFSASRRTEVFVKTLPGSPLPAVFFRLHAFSLLARFFRSFALTYSKSQEQRCYNKTKRQEIGKISVRSDQVSLYRGSFSYILRLLRWRIEWFY